MRSPWLATVFTLAFAALPAGAQAEFESSFGSTPDRVWIGADYWANPMEDWQVAGGRLECLSGGANRNVHLLTRELIPGRGALAMAVAFELIERGRAVGSAGFRVGARDEIEDYRAAALRGRGLECGLSSAGLLFLGEHRIQLQAPIDAGVLRLEAMPAGAQSYRLTLRVLDPARKRTLASLVAEDIPAQRLGGNLALVCNHPAIVGPKVRRAARYAFRRWKVSGSALATHPERAFGPILWAMHTLSNSRGPQGYVLKMTAQMPPLGARDSDRVVLQTREQDRWQDLATARIHPDARTATFRIPHWPAGRDVPYRLSYSARPGEVAQHYAGTVRRDPRDRPLVIAGFTGNTDYVFPNRELARNVAIQDPDVLFFSGDQIYEGVGGYGIIRQPAERSILNYLRKWYLLGWAFGDLMRDRVTICLPDDHDVYQGNIWGQGGRDCGGIRGHATGGYAQPVAMVNAVHRTQTSHHPDPFDPTPIERGISVYYGDMVYGGVGFAILADRMFKSGPQGKVNTWKGRPDHVKDPEVDVRALDKPGLVLLGDRQLAFLRHFAADWRGCDMKIVLSQTIFCNLANYHGPRQEFIIADLDSNGWPQSGRNRALDAMRRGFALHIAGDQHLPSLVWHGIESFRDAGWSFCVPSIAAGYPRSWRPDREGRPVANRPAPGLPDTGDYRDGFGNEISVYAVGNPAAKNRPGRLRTAHDKASGHGIVRVDHAAGTFTLECWRLLFDAAHPRPSDQFPGWPRTISLFDNYGRKAAAYLPAIEVKGLENPVVQVIAQSSGEIVYTVRIRGRSFRPKVFSKGIYTLRVGEPDSETWKVLESIEASSTKGREVITIAF